MVYLTQRGKSGELAGLRLALVLTLPGTDFPAGPAAASPVMVPYRVTSRGVFGCAFPILAEPDEGLP